MSRKNNLLSIGDVSKLTGASVRSLRYYEKIGILTPAYISPDSNYRYYSKEQMPIVEMIMLCIELDIPLSELAKVANPISSRPFLEQVRKTAEGKLDGLRRGLELMDAVERKMN